MTDISFLIKKVKKNFRIVSFYYKFTIETMKKITIIKIEES